MAIDGDDDDVDINPFAMLLPDDQKAEAEAKEAEGEDETRFLAEHEATHQLQQHHIRSIDSAILIRQLQSEGLSFQLWPAATTFLALLDRHRSDPNASPLAPTLSSAAPTSGRLRILELGSGTGLVGIAAAIILGAVVTVTDLPHVLPNLRFNVESNSKVLAEHGGRVDVAPLRWGETEDMEALGRGYDVIVASDVVYHDHLYEPLLRTLKFLMLEGEKRMVFVMAHLKRWKKESVFFKRARKLFDIEVIHADGPSNESRIGVVLYRFAAKCNMN
ncbi:LOW QUALITY PROTEIN: uncharacterized protein LOC127803921 [Diospyros lotus]|uniref:LOW QUALITY PROTEIN: uncharacterized protein LOC127803921 n=1 Tax=Diospyros lotus TaxID=55363 RepID=UPI0022585E89|nr:LOW QUALITY PROTEIN: uncharacterized protein LOC127803921 [Diospyros lotus]